MVHEVTITIMDCLLSEASLLFYHIFGNKIAIGNTLKLIKQHVVALFVAHYTQFNMLT